MDLHGGFSVAHMRKTDRRAIEGLGIPSAVLMERAGMAVFEHIDKGPVTVVCGKGNNGGDGFVVARHALLSGLETHVIALATDDELSPDALVFKNVYTRLGGRCKVCTSETDVMNALANVADDGVLVDAMLGTGVRGGARGLIARVIEDLNGASCRVVSVDLPSGVDADSIKDNAVNIIIATVMGVIAFAE